jgi:hypothetical protein
VILAGLVILLGASATTLVARNTLKLSTSISTEEESTADETMGNDEPNPPTLPESMILFYPPKNNQDIEHIQTTLNSYSDPTMTWEEYSKSDDKEDRKGRPDFTYTTANHFSTQRTAFLFAPGIYPNLDFEVGYYTSILGLGQSPTDVQFTNCNKGPHVPALEKFKHRAPNGSGLDTFWRSIENIATDAREGMQWVVSQAAPLRRVHLRTDLNLYDGDAYVSGGVAANAIVDGRVNFGGQQQWLMRNVELKGGGENGAWSLVFVGCSGNVPNENNGLQSGPSISVESKPTIRVEKPYITLKTSGAIHEEHYQFELRVPSVTYGNDAIGPQFVDTHEEVRNFKQVYLAVPSNSTNNAAEENYAALQKALDEGKDLVFSPGIYSLANSLKVKHPNQVILGLGFATLSAPDDGSPCIHVLSQVPGVRIAGVMLEASVLKGLRKGKIASLLEWGEQWSNDPGDETNPGVLSDVFARVGGLMRDVSTDVMIRLHSGNIYGDNLWLWRADHTQLQPNEMPNYPDFDFWQTVKEESVVKNGLVVESGATNVTIVGLAVEHTTEDQVIWNGDYGEQFAAISDSFLLLSLFNIVLPLTLPYAGQVLFYQSELPYDADSSFADMGYVGYRVESTHHKAMGLGIYSNFRDHDIAVKTAIQVPKENSNGIQMMNMFTVKLDNMGKISSVVNGKQQADTGNGIIQRCTNLTHI